jgi:hypothetical protein
VYVFFVCVSNVITARPRPCVLKSASPRGSLAADLTTVALSESLSLMLQSLNNDQNYNRQGAL